MCPDPTYSVTETSVPATFPLSWVSFDDSSLTFTADSSDNNDAGTYTIEITAEYADGTSATDSFDWVVTPCVMTPAAITDVSFDIYSGSSTFTVDAFTLSGGHCPAPDYTAIE